MLGEHKILYGWKRCIMPIQRTILTAAIDENSGSKRGIRRKGDRCKKLVPPDIAAALGAPVCQVHVPHYIASLKSSIAHDSERRAKLDPGCAVE